MKNFLHDFTLFVVDIHQMRLISLFRTTFNHFHFHGSAGLVPKLILTPCHILSLLVMAYSFDMLPSF